MGLKSLPILNKSGISIYWHNIWDSIKLYKKYNLSMYFINDIINYFINENLYYYCVINIKTKNNLYKYKGNKNINDDKNNFSKMKNFYLGKIFILNNQGWLIILINYYVSKRYKLLTKYDEIFFFKKLFKSFRVNMYKYKQKNYSYNYKFKF